MNVDRATEQRLLMNRRLRRFVVANRCRKCLVKSAFNRLMQSIRDQWSGMMHVMKGGKGSKGVIIEVVLI